MKRGIFMTIKIIEKICGQRSRSLELKNALNDLAGFSRKEAGCLQYDLFQDKNKSYDFYIYMVFQDELAYNTHINSPHIKSFTEKHGVDLYTDFEEIFLEKIS